MCKRRSGRKSDFYQVKEPTTLLPFLLKVMSGRSRNSVKSILTRGQVAVDDQGVTAHNYKLEPGQIVTILKNTAARRESKLTGVTILYEDKDIIVINKEPGLLSIASGKEKEITAHRQLIDYVRRENPRTRIFIVHRLDRDTSGVMLFAKSEQIKKTLQHSWNHIMQERAYTAIVEGRVRNETGTVSSWLKETKSYKVYSSTKPGDGKHAVTHYKKLQENKQFTMLEAYLETGRKNQIRVHMQDIGHPIAGDKKYGAAGNPIGRLGLHASTLAFIHPVTKKSVRFKAELPKTFLRLFP